MVCLSDLGERNAPRPVALFNKYHPINSSIAPLGPLPPTPPRRGLGLGEVGLFGLLDMR